MSIETYMSKILVSVILYEQVLVFCRDATIACTAAICSSERVHGSSASSNLSGGRSAMMMGPIVPAIHTE